jgi:hypothetical protein
MSLPSKHSSSYQAAKDSFERQTGYPHGKSGYVVDHVVPLGAASSVSTSVLAFASLFRPSVTFRRMTPSRLPIRDLVYYMIRAGGHPCPS